MFNILFGVSLTLNVVFIIGIYIYFKIKAFGMKKIEKEFLNKFYCTDDELNNMLDSL